MRVALFGLLLLLATASASAQGPCASIEVFILNRGYLGAEQATINFHQVTSWVSASDSTVTYTINPDPLYSGQTDEQGVFRLRGANVTTYEIRAHGADGSIGNARLYCASASESKVVIRLTPPYDNLN